MYLTTVSQYIDTNGKVPLGDKLYSHLHLVLVALLGHKYVLKILNSQLMLLHYLYSTNFQFTCLHIF